MMKRQREHRVYRGPPEKIATETYVSEFGSPIDLFVVYNFIPIDDSILGVFFGGDTRGKYSVKGKKVANSDKLPNQISLIVHPPGFGYPTDKGVNVKLFSNGSIQMTGCKMPAGTVIEATLEQYAYKVAEAVIDIIHSRLYVMVGVYQETVYNFKGLLIGHKSSRIYNSSGKIIGKKSLSKSNVVSYRIQDDEINPASLKSKTFTNLTKYYYNVEGERIGEQRICFDDAHKEYNDLVWMNPASPSKNRFLYHQQTRNRVRLQEKETESTELDIIDRYNTDKIGETTTTMYADIPPVARVEQVESIVHEYSAFEHREQSQRADPKLSLSNGYYSLGIHLDLLQSANLLKDWDLDVEYSPDKYHGLKIYYYPNDDCVCLKNECKCKTTIMIFSTGKVMISAKSMNDMKNSYNVVADFVTQNYENVVTNFEDSEAKKPAKKRQRKTAEAIA